MTSSKTILFYQRLKTGFKHAGQMNKKIKEAGVWNASQEHDACGVGFVASVDGSPFRRSVVNAAIEALQSIWHRGAVDADGMTGDGAGIHLAIPREFFIKHIARTGHEDDGGKLAVGMVFLPRNDLGAQKPAAVLLSGKFLIWAISSMAGVRSL